MFFWLVDCILREREVDALLLEMESGPRTVEDSDDEAY